MNDIEMLRDEQLSKDLDFLIDKYGIDYAQKMKTLLKVKIERRKYELQKQDLEKYRQVNGIVSRNANKR